MYRQIRTIVLGTIALTATWDVATINFWCLIDRKINFMAVCTAHRLAAQRHLKILAWELSDESWRNTRICVLACFHGSILVQLHTKAVQFVFEIKAEINLLTQELNLCLHRHARDEIGGRHVWIDILPGLVGRMQLFGNVFWCYFHRITDWNHCYFNDHFASTAKQVGHISAVVVQLKQCHQTFCACIDDRHHFHFRYALAFLTPGLPFIPAIAITVNIYLIFKLNILTLVRFTVWMTLGLIMYFYYGITHSSLENTQEEIELTVDQSTFLNVPLPKQNNHHHNQPTAVWDRHGYENKMAEEDSWSASNNYSTNSWQQTTTTTTKPTNRPPPPPRPQAKKGPVGQTSSSTSSASAPAPPSNSGFGGIFIDETQFPTWDD